MRIVFLSPYPVQGGGNRVIGIYAAGLQALGHDVTVVSVAERPISVKAKIKKLLRTGKLPRQESLQGNFINPTFRNVFSAKNDEIRSSDVPEGDVIVATWWETAVWLGHFSNRTERLFYFMQDYGAGGMELDRIIPTWFLPFKIITIAPWMKRLILSCNPGKDIAVIENGVEAIFSKSTYREAFPSVIFGHVFTHFQAKGSRFVLAAFEQFVKIVPEAKLLCFGNDRPDDMNIPGLEFHYNLDIKELSNVYGRCRSWIVASRAEGFGLPILESFAAGTPVISTPVGIAPDIVSDQTGLLLTGFEVEDIIDAMKKMAGISEEHWLTMSRNCTDIARNYDWDSRVRSFEKELNGGLVHVRRA